MRWLVAVLLLLTADFCGAESWHVAKPHGLGLVIEFPLKPNLSEQTVDLGKTGKATMRVHQVRTSNAIYDLTVVDYPKGALTEPSETQLDNARDGALRNAMGPLIAETKITVAGQPARELLIDMTMGYLVRSRIFFVGDRLFNVGAITKKGNETSADIEKYFASFKLTPK